MEKEEKVKKPMSARKKKFLAFLAVTLATGVSTLGVYGATELYDSFFMRYDRPDYALIAGIRRIEQTTLYREEFFFPSDRVKLKGYFYPADDEKGMVVISHGLHTGCDDYLPIIEYLVDNNYSVFGYNYKGTYESEGDSTVGMCESLVDLDHALDYIKKEKKYADKKIFLLGHSWGGFATAAVLSIHKEVAGAACIAPFNNGYTLIEEKGSQYAGKFASEGVPKAFLGAYQKFLFGKYTDYDGVKGINSVDVPVLIAHGVNDKVINYDLQSIICHRDEINNDIVEYYVGTEAHAGHESIWLSDRAAAYREEVKKGLDDREKDKGEKMSYEEKVDYYKNVDDRLYSEINYELFDRIIAMFGRA